MDPNIKVALLVLLGVIVFIILAGIFGPMIPDCTGVWAGGEV